MSDFETYLIRQCGMTTQSAAAVAASLAKVDALIGPGEPSTDRERMLRRQARGAMSPGDISSCVAAMRSYGQYVGMQAA